MTWRVVRGDCVERMRELDECSVDAVVCDPPAGISFMSKDWDHHRGGRNAWVEWMADVLREAHRVCKPGAHAFVWAIPRTSHWTGSALELAGWEVRDVVTHLFGSGFPKSHNLPNGFGTALKPAAEFWWLARKPLSGTVAGNVLEHGTGALNVDGCRIEGDVPSTTHGVTDGDHIGQLKGRPLSEFTPNDGGRWPANVVLDEQAARLLDEQTGEVRSAGLFPGSTPNGGYGGYAGAGVQGPLYDDQGGASRFYYVAKASRAERNAGLEGFEGTNVNDGRATSIDNPYQRGDTIRQNVHPTVKPIDLMRWLVRLVTPPGGLVLDPFAGSGTTGCAAVLEGFDFIGIEREPEYAAIAEARIGWWHKHRADGEAARVLAAGTAREALEATGQGSLFEEAA